MNSAVPMRTHLFRAAVVTAALVSAATAQPQETDPDECGTHPDAAGCQPSYQHLDWVPYQNLPAELQIQRAEHCGGGYLDPLRHLDTSQNPAEANIEASSINSEIEGQIFRLSGGVRLHQGYRQLAADRAEYDRMAGIGTLEGEVEFREPGILMRGDRAWLDVRSGEARLYDSEYVLHEIHAHGGAGLISRREDKVIELDSAYYSSCPPSGEFWRLSAEQLELNVKEGVGTARKAKLALNGRSVFYFPYLQFPIDDRRKSGFLWPELGKDSTGGLDFALPYYLNLAPNYDATFTPRLVDDRGLLLELQGRYLGPWLGFWDAGGSYIDGDKKYREENEAVSDDRWLGTVNQAGLIAQRWRTFIDYTKTSDDDYLNDIGTSSLDVRQSTHLIQRGQLDYLGNNWRAQLRLEQFQTIAKDITTNPYKKLPQLSLHRTAPIEDYSPNVLFESEYTHFDHDSLLTGQRLYNEIGVNYPLSRIWGELTPLLKYRQINYDLDAAVVAGPHTGDSPDVGAPLFSLDGGLFFERDMSWGNHSFMQTLEPRLFYLWADYEDQTGLPNFDTSRLTFSYNQLFRETRFSGHDRLNDANQVSVGLTTRIIDPATGRQRLNASIGQIYYFEDRRVNAGVPEREDMEGSSAIAAEFGMAPLANLDFNSSWLWNTDDNKLDETHIWVAYLTPRQRIFNVGYNYRRYTGTDPRQNDINQVDLSTYLPIAKHWSLFFQSLYDLDEKDSINDIVGIEYNACCWRLRLVHQRSLNQAFGSNVGSLLDTKKATFIEFQLKGLGGVGTRVTSILEENIRGYESSDY
ncbi:MAG: LPS-assembly protein LptD [Gammaproteobacteria bacterium]|nr:LPS-assembly protein LptD [Gammaproteobacteria bacterium]